MSLPLLITHEAELEDAKSWYRQKREGLDEEFILRGSGARSHLPFSHGYYRSLHRSSASRGKTLSLLHLLPNIDPNQIEVLAVYHNETSKQARTRLNFFSPIQFLHPCK
jgi:hypothetical protein